MEWFSAADEAQAALEKLSEEEKKGTMENEAEAFTSIMGTRDSKFLAATQIFATKGVLKSARARMGGKGISQEDFLEILLLIQQNVVRRYETEQDKKGSSSSGDPISKPAVLEKMEEDLATDRDKFLELFKGFSSDLENSSSMKMMLEN